ncbi:MAG: polysaccharide deacetylase family protein [Desulfovibrio sp.]|jgi:peptidoglycan/xylan/chitin deacetylase (PgdA/CDA1 family)|nr:polysaccharide deacetylase family protein [Desulfovibrio sp.]
MRKTAPKYPRRGTILKRRFLSQGLLLLFGIGLALFYVLMNAAPSGDENAALDQLVESLEKTPGARTEDAPEQAGVDPEPSPASAAPSVAPDGSKTSAGTKAQPSSRPEAVEANAPFAAMSLDAAAVDLARRYAGKAPSEWGERLPGITTRLNVEAGGTNAAGAEGLVLALTLDACGGKKGVSYDAGLIDFLRERRVPATIFVTSIWLRDHPEEVRALAADPLFEIAAHGARHRPCSVNGKSVYGIKGTASVADLVREVDGNARDIARSTGRRPRWFRAGTAYYDDIAVSVIRDLGLGIAGYSIAGDEGATLSADRVTKKLLAARNGDILLLHMNKPQSGAREGLKKALPVLVQRGARFVRLSDIPSAFKAGAKSS